MAKRRNLTRIADPWLAEAKRLVISVGLIGSPSGMEGAGTHVATTAYGDVSVSYLPVNPTRGLERDNIIALKQAINRYLGNPGGRPFLSHSARTDSIAIVAGVVLAELNLDESPAISGANPNKKAMAIADEVFPAIDEFLRICVVTMESEDIPLDRTAFAPFAGMTFVDSEGNIMEHHYFRIPVPPPYTMDPATVAARFKHSRDSHKRGHPIDQVIIWKVLSRRQLNLQSDYAASAISLNTSIEICIWSCLRALHQDLLRSQNPSDKAEAGPVGNIINNARPNLASAVCKLGTLLDTSSWELPHAGKGIVGQPRSLVDYWTTAYPLRNKVVHGGYQPSRSELQDAYDAYEKLWDSMRDLVAANALRFPGLALMLLGNQEMLNRGMWTQAIQTAFESVDLAHPNGVWNPP